MKQRWVAFAEAIGSLIKRNDLARASGILGDWKQVAGFRIEDPGVSSHTFTNPRFAAKQHQRSRHQPAAEHAIQLGRAGSGAPVSDGLDLGKRDRRRAAYAGGVAPGWASRCDDCLGE